MILDADKVRQLRARGCSVFTLPERFPTLPDPNDENQVPDNGSPPRLVVRDDNGNAYDQVIDNSQDMSKLLDNAIAYFEDLDNGVNA